MSERQSVALLCHPASAGPVVAAIVVEVAVTPSSGLSLVYRLDGRLDEVRIPAVRPAGFRDGLWEHTCFEVFVAASGQPGYREFNFSPSGEWAAYGFSSYRVREVAARPAGAPGIAVRRSANRLELEVELAADWLPNQVDGAALQLGLSAVVEAQNGSRSYWALAHAAGQPDFHRRDAFILNIPASSPDH